MLGNRIVCVSYRAEHLYAIHFLKCIQVFYRSKVSKVSKIKFMAFVSNMIFGFHGGTPPPMPAHDHEG